MRARTYALLAGIAAAAAAFTTLCMNASALTVQVRGQLPAASPERAYDILVRVPSRVAQQAGAGSLARPTDLAELSGGITLAQYDTIRRLPGVQVAAPMTMIGYVPLTVIIPVTVPASALTSTPALFTVTAQQRVDAGLSIVTEPNVGSMYVTTSPLSVSTGGTGPSAGDVEAAPDGAVTLVCPRTSPTPLPSVFSVDAQRRTACWSTATGPDPADWSGRSPASISVPFAWTFLLPLVAVDPTAEVSLLNLDRAVTQGSYLPTTGVAHPGSVPVIIADSIDDDAQDSLSLSRLPASAAGSYASGLTPDQINALLDATSGQVIGTADTVTAAQAYRELLGSLLRSHWAAVPAYWTPEPAHYAVGADGALIPQQVAADPADWTGPYALTGEDAATADAADVGFRVLIPHVATSVTSSADSGQSSSGAGLHVVGVFNPHRIASSMATPSPYLGERLTGADAASRRLLGGGTLAPDGNPAGYPSPGATLVMPLQDIGAFTAAGTYTHTDPRAPIGSIRVRVAGVTGDGALSQARVRMVAQEIVRATGLHVDVTLAASAARRTVVLAAGHDGRPALSVSETWYRSDTETTVSSAVDPRSVALSAVVLLAGSAFVVSDSAATLYRRRRDLATMRALGWRRRRVVWQLLLEFALISAAAGLVAVGLSYALAAAIGCDPATWWPLLSLPAAVAMTMVAAPWQVRRATAEPPASTAEPGAWASPRARPGGVFGHAVPTMLRAPRHAALCTSVVTVACALLGLELAVRWVFGGAVVGSWLGQPFSWQDDPVDLAAVLTVVVLAAITVTDIRWFSAGEHAVELRTLRAIGWSAVSVARLAAGEAMLPGLAGGAIASALDVMAIGTVVHSVPSGLLPVVGIVVATGAVTSLIAAALSAAAEQATRALGLTQSR